MRFRSRQVQDPGAQQNFDQLEGFFGPGVCILNHTVLALTSGVAALVPWDTEIHDPAGMHVPNATGIVVPQKGCYHIAAQAQLQAGAPGGAFTWSQNINLTTAVTQGTPTEVVLGNGAVGFNYTDGCSGYVFLNAGDVVEYQLSQNTGVARNAVGLFISVAWAGP